MLALLVIRRAAEDGEPSNERVAELVLRRWLAVMENVCLARSRRACANTIISLSWKSRRLEAAARARDRECRSRTQPFRHTSRARTDRFAELSRACARAVREDARTRGRARCPE